jgi:hypothetical protein
VYFVALALWSSLDASYHRRSFVALFFSSSQEARFRKRKVAIKMGMEMMMILANDVYD